MSRFHPVTLQAFCTELEKIAKPATAIEKKKEREKQLRTGKTRAGEAYANRREEEYAAKASLIATGLGVGTLALIKDFLPGKQPSTHREMFEYARDMRNKMGVGPKVEINVPPAFTRESWAPYYMPYGDKHVNIPLRSRDAIIAHEFGHAKNDQVMKALGTAPHIAYHGIETLSRIAAAPSAAWAMMRSSRDTDPSYKSAIINAAINAPMLAEEAAASIRAASHLMKEHGTAKGAWKSSLLLPAFATYGALTAAPFLITRHRKKVREQHQNKD